MRLRDLSRSERERFADYLEGVRQQFRDMLVRYRALPTREARDAMRGQTAFLGSLIGWLTGEIKRMRLTNAKVQSVPKNASKKLASHANGRWAKRRDTDCRPGMERDSRAQ